MQPPCGGCGNAQVGKELPGQCHFCWLAYNNPRYRVWLDYLRRKTKPRLSIDDLAAQRRH